MDKEYLFLEFLSNYLYDIFIYPARYYEGRQWQVLLIVSPIFNSCPAYFYVSSNCLSKEILEMSIV